MVLVALKPIVMLMYELLSMASAKWDLQNAARAARGQPKQHRILECYSGKLTLRFAKRVLDIFREYAVWDTVLTQEQKTIGNRAIAFKLLSRSVCSVQAKLDIYIGKVIRIGGFQLCAAAPTQSAWQRTASAGSTTSPCR